MFLSTVEMHKKLSFKTNLGCSCKDRSLWMLIFCTMHLNGMIIEYYATLVTTDIIFNTIWKRGGFEDGEVES
jgi:hypothetical protein